MGTVRPHQGPPRPALRGNRVLLSDLQGWPWPRPQAQWRSRSEAARAGTGVGVGESVGGQQNPPPPPYGFWAGAPTGRARSLEGVHGPPYS